MLYAIEQKTAGCWVRTGHAPSSDKMAVEWSARAMEKTGERYGERVLCRIVEVHG